MEYRCGHAGFRDLQGVKAIQQMLAVGWENVVDPGLAAEELIDAGERVVVRWRGWGRRASGLPVDWRDTHIYELPNGKVVAVREYRSWEIAPIASSVCRRFGRVVANRWPQSASDRAGYADPASMSSCRGRFGSPAACRASSRVRNSRPRAIFPARMVKMTPKVSSIFSPLNLARPP